jgi:hypothetical protein
VLRADVEPPLALRLENGGVVHWKFLETFFGDFKKQTSFREEPNSRFFGTGKKRESFSEPKIEGPEFEDARAR